MNAAHPRETIERLEEKAAALRRDVVEMIYRAGDGHPSPCLSVADIVTALYFHILSIRPEDPGWPDRDRLVLSKGHSCPVVYAALARRGYFPVELLATLRTLGSPLQGHPDAKKTPGVDSTTGSLGNGVSIGLGMAMGARLLKKDFRVYVVTGDGELGEGLVWEAAMAAAKMKAASLTVIVDNNQYQSGGTVDVISGLYPLRAKWEAFGWSCLEIDGHDFGQILEAAAAARAETGRPTAIIARTVKGKGVSFMIGDNSWHKRAFNAEEYERAMRELGGCPCS